MPRNPGPPFCTSHTGSWLFYPPFGGSQGHWECHRAVRVWDRHPRWLLPRHSLPEGVIPRVCSLQGASGGGGPGVEWRRTPEARSPSRRGSERACDEGPWAAAVGSSVFGTDGCGWRRDRVGPCKGRGGDQGVVRSREVNRTCFSPPLPSVVTGHFPAGRRRGPLREVCSEGRSASLSPAELFAL